jgi:hypothetical protein
MARAGYRRNMRTEPLISMLGILVALAMMMGIYLLAYRYYRTRKPRNDPRDR